MKPLKLTQEQKKAVARALFRYRKAIIGFASGARVESVEVLDALYELLGLLGIPLKDWEEM